MMGFSALFAQHRVTGKVTSSEDGAPIPYVTVVVVGTTISTNKSDGSYSINVPTGNNILRFTFMGMQTVNAELTAGRWLTWSCTPMSLHWKTLWLWHTVQLRKSL